MKFFVIYKKISDGTIGGVWVTSKDKEYLLWTFKYPIPHEYKLDILYIFKPK